MIKHHPGWLPKSECNTLFAAAKNMPLEQRSIEIYEKTIPMPRLTAWCNDRDFGYHYSNQVTPTVPWPDEVAAVRTRLEAFTGAKLASVLVTACVTLPV